MAIKHGVHDTDTHFIIDPITRAAKNDTTKKVSIVKDDHNSEVCTFELPRYVEGHDMSQCNKVEVHYLNTHGTTKAKSTGIYEIADFKVDEDNPDYVVGSWLIDCLATKYPGSLAFSIHFACVDESGVVAYWWSSATNTSISVLDSVNHTGSGGGGGGSETSDLQEKTATPADVTQVIRPDNGFYGLAKVTVEAIPEEYVAPAGSLFVGANGNYEVREFESITVNVPPTLQDKTITANGVYTPSTGFDGFGAVEVNIADAPATLQEKTLYPSSFEQSVEPDDGFDGLSKVTLEAMRLQSVTVETNGEVVPSHGFDGLSSVTVNVKSDTKLQSKSMTFTQEGEVEIVPDSGYGGLSSVKVKVEVEGSGELQTKVIKNNGEHEPEEGYDGFDKVKVEVPQNVYTGVEYMPGTTHPVYGPMIQTFPIGGYVATPTNGEPTDGVLYTQLNFSTMSLSSSTGATIGSGSYKIEIAPTIYDYSTAKVLFNGTSATSNIATFDPSCTGLRLKWDSVSPPDPAKGFPNGYANVQVCFCYVSAQGVQEIGNRFSHYVGFAGEAEYHAALNLVVQRTTLVQINEEIFYPANAADETEG